MEHQIFDLTFAGSRESVLCGFPDEEAVLKVVETIRQKLDEIEHLHQRLKDMDGQW